MQPSSPPDSRVYIHKDCGTGTEINGKDFRRMCDPLDQVAGTFCCECNAMVSLSSISWEDTGETIADYRRRLRKQTSPLLKAWNYGLGLVIGAVLGGGVGWLLPGKNALSGAIAFALLGSIVIYVVGGLILLAIYKTDNRLVR